MASELDGIPPQRIEPRRPISAYAINQPSAASFKELAAITRTSSEPNLKDTPQDIINDKWRPTPYLCKYYHNKVWDDDHTWDQYSITPKFWPTHTRGRYYFSAPSYDYYFYYPQKTLYPKFNRWSYTDTMDMQYWRRYRDPYYDHPQWFPYRPWVYESQDAERAIKMYKQNLISYDALNRYWMNPYVHQGRSGNTCYMSRPLLYRDYPQRLNSYFQDTAVF